MSNLLQAVLLQLLDPVIQTFFCSVGFIYFVQSQTYKSVVDNGFGVTEDISFGIEHLRKRYSRVL